MFEFLKPKIEDQDKETNTENEPQNNVKEDIKNEKSQNQEEHKKVEDINEQSNQKAKKDESIPKDIPKGNENQYFCSHSDCQCLLKNNESHSIHENSIVEIPQILINSYSFLKPVGVGSYGAVFKVTDKHDLGEYALKLCLKREGESELEEINILKDIYHKNILRYYRSIIDPKKKFIAIITELCDFDLTSAIKKGLSLEEMIDFTIQICKGINYLHNKSNQKIIHRDLKPGNILIKNKTIKISDFGESRIKKSNSAQQLSNTFQVRGTQKYLAPEFLEDLYSDSVQINDKSDIWSLGIIFHQMYSNGNHPFISKKGDKLIKNVITNKLSIDPVISENSIAYGVIKGFILIFNFLLKIK